MTHHKNLLFLWYNQDKKIVETMKKKSVDDETKIRMD